MKRFLALMLIAAWAATSARAAIGTPVNIGQTNASAVATLTLSSTADSPAGNLTVVAVTTHGTVISGVSDGVSGNYALCAGPYIVGAERVSLYAVTNSADLPSGSAINIALATTAANKVIMSAATVSGVRPTQSCDINGPGATGTGPGAISGPTTGTLSGSPEIAFGLIKVVSAVPGESFTQPAGWSGLTSSGSTGTSSILDWGYQLVSSTASVSYSPTLSSTSRTWLANTATFYDASVPLPASTGSRMSLTGVGH